MIIVLWGLLVTFKGVFLTISYGGRDLFVGQTYCVDSYANGYNFSIITYGVVVNAMRYVDFIFLWNVSVLRTGRLVTFNFAVLTNGGRVTMTWVFLQVFYNGVYGFNVLYVSGISFCFAIVVVMFVSGDRNLAMVVEVVIHGAMFLYNVTCVARVVFFNDTGDGNGLFICTLGMLGVFLAR